MDLSEIPFNTPIIIHSIRMQMNLKNPLGSKKARCLTDNRDMYEHVMLHRVRDDKVAIQSRRNGRFLQVRTCGECVFDPTEPGDWELFTMETSAECSLYFVSCHTGKVLQCANKGIVQCANQRRDWWEEWRIVETRISAAVPSMQEHASNLRYALADTDRQHVVLELAKCGKTPDEIEQIVTRLFDGPADLYASSSTVAVPVAKE